jgi:hypothetical protein
MHHVLVVCTHMDVAVKRGRILIQTSKKSPFFDLSEQDFCCIANPTKLLNLQGSYCYDWYGGVPADVKLLAIAL